MTANKSNWHFCSVSTNLYYLLTYMVIQVHQELANFVGYISMIYYELVDNYSINNPLSMSLRPTEYDVSHYVEHTQFDHLTTKPLAAVFTTVQNLSVCHALSRVSTHFLLCIPSKAKHNKPTVTHPPTAQRETDHLLSITFI